MTERERHEAHVRQRREALRALCHRELAGIERLVLEIGCGHGHFLTEYAEANPEKFFLGIDLKAKRIRKGESKSHKRQLENLLFMKAEGFECLQSLPDGLLLEQVFILFPDPWPKKRHFKNRLMQAPFLSALAPLMAPEGLLCFRTDHAGYFEWTMQQIALHPDWSLEENEDWPFEAASFFQNLMDNWFSLMARAGGSSSLAKPI